MLAEKLERTGIKVKIIEQNIQRCAFLADSLKKALVLQGNGTDLELLESEAIAAADVCVCTTNNDEKNLLCSLLIKQLGANGSSPGSATSRTTGSLNRWASMWSFPPRLRR